MGDIILATSALAVAAAKNEKMDWLIASEYASLIEGHPSIGRIFTFDRKNGDLSKIANELAQQNYSQVFDLHRSLRSFILKRKLLSRSPQIRWTTIRKDRLKLWGLYIFKNFWPKIWCPKPWVSKYSEIVEGQGEEKPNLTHLISKPFSKLDSSKKYFAVMPDSLWRGKRFPVSLFFDFICSVNSHSENRLIPVILGSDADYASFELVEQLKNKNLPHLSFVGTSSLRDVANVLARCEFFIGNDSGIGHLAESVGCKTMILFGPTRPQIGFAPWQKNSVSISSEFKCGPCGKDGRFCYRFWDRYGCLNSIGVNQLIQVYTEEFVQRDT